MQGETSKSFQEGTFLPVGATSPKKTDVRIVAATNKDIKKMMEGEFREDLYYRINVINVALLLKDRSEDIPLLMDHFLRRDVMNQGMHSKTF